MKFRPSLLLALAFAAMVSMSSCIKNYVCHCDITYSGQPGLPSPAPEEYNIKDTKNNAKSKCMANSSTSNNNGITTVANCYLY
jgi:hypothetical protein